MTKKLPPWNKMELDCLDATLKDGGYSIEIRADILRRCEMHDRLVEALKLNLAEQLRIQGRMDLDDSPGVIMARAILKENQ